MILASMALVQYRNSITAAKEATLRSQLFIMRDAIDQYYADKGKYPESLQTLVSDSYLRAVPRDSPHHFVGHVANRTGRAGRKQQHGVSGHFRRQEWLRGKRPRW
jgi:type II secretory pathway pseudopilin PulG